MNSNNNATSGTPQSGGGETELLPCPFCGGPAGWHGSDEELTLTAAHGDGCILKSVEFEYVIDLDVDDMIFGSEDYSVEEYDLTERTQAEFDAAVAAWNTRATPSDDVADALRLELAAHRDALVKIQQYAIRSANHAQQRSDAYAPSVGGSVEYFNYYRGKKDAYENVRDMIPLLNNEVMPATTDGTSSVHSVGEGAKGDE